MGDGEDNGPIIGGEEEFPEEERVGRQLQAFFLELFRGTNLQQYRSNREEYINQRRSRLLPATQRLLDSADLRELEEEIDKITGSRAVLLFVVCPPM